MALNKDYQLTEAQVCATLCKFAYAEENSKSYVTIKNAIINYLANANYATGTNWELIWLGISDDYGNLMYMVANKNVSGQFAIAHRGTDWSFIDDVAEDLKVYSTTTWPYANPVDANIQVANGALEGLGILKNMTSDVFNLQVAPDVSHSTTLIGLIKSLVLTNDNDIDIFVTGHSLGGALCTIYTSWLIDTAAQWNLPNNKINFKAYTVASPTVGNQAYADYYNANGKQNKVGFAGYRIHNMQDLVPYAFGNLKQLSDNGIPLSEVFKVELNIVIEGLYSILRIKNITYVQAGIDKPLVNNTPNTTCASPAKNIKEYGCWVGYEHDMNTYLKLLGATEIVS